MTNVACGDIWLVNYSPSIGHEYQKIRPAIVISSDALLKRSSLFTCIAVTSKTTKIKPDDIELPKTTKNKLHQDSVVKMHHVTSYDNRRLHKYIGVVDTKILETIKTRLKELYELS